MVQNIIVAMIFVMKITVVAFLGVNITIALSKLFKRKRIG
jgi:hypothetical protein